MKRLLPVVPLLLLVALLLSPADSLAGAKRGILLWWSSVFPALLPSFICLKLAQKLGLLCLADRHPKGRSAVLFGFSLMSGAPNGARLLHALMEKGDLSARECEWLLPLANNISPVFLISIIASELLKNKALIPSLAVPFYGSILLLSIPVFLRHEVSDHSVGSSLRSPMAFADALTAAIEESMLDMLRIGGCILFSCTVLALIQSFLLSDEFSAILAALMEISSGTAAVARLSLPLRLKVSLLIGISAFGGLSLALQTMCCYPELRLVPYLIRKLLLGVLAGLCCYLLFPLFPSVATTFANRQNVIERSLSLSALLLSSALSAAFVGLLSLMMTPRKRI